MNIPKLFHFVFFGFTKFTYVHYLSIISCYLIHKPDKIYLYYHHIPDKKTETIWWKKIQHLITLEYVDLPTSIFGMPVKKYQHMADIIRLQKLIERGGVYLDLDVVSIRPFKHLYREQCVLGVQCPGTKYEGLCNAVIMAEPSSYFLKKWYLEYKTFKSHRWDYHSVKLPLLLSRLYNKHLHIVDYTFFFPVSWLEDDFIKSRKYDYRLKNTMVVHLWESIWDKTVLKNCDESLLNLNSTFSLYLNPITKVFNSCYNSYIYESKLKQDNKLLTNIHLRKNDVKLVTSKLNVIPTKLITTIDKISINSGYSKEFNECKLINEKQDTILIDSEKPVIFNKDNDINTTLNSVKLISVIDPDNNDDITRTFDIIKDNIDKLLINYRHAIFNVSFIITDNKYDIYNFNNNIIKIEKVSEKNSLYQHINNYEYLPNSVLYINDMIDIYDNSKTCVIFDYSTMCKLITSKTIKILLKPKIGIVGIIQVNQIYLYAIICVKFKNQIYHSDLKNNKVSISYSKIQDILKTLKAYQVNLPKLNLSIEHYITSKKKGGINDFYILCNTCLSTINIILLTNDSKLNICYTPQQDTNNILDKLYLPTNIVLWKIYKSVFPQLLLVKSKKITRCLPHSSVYPIRRLNNIYKNVYKSNIFFI